MKMKLGLEQDPQGIHHPLYPPSPHVSVTANPASIKTNKTFPVGGPSLSVSDRDGGKSHGWGGG